MTIFIPDCRSCGLKITSIRLCVSISVLISWVFCSFELETSGKTHRRREHKTPQVNPLLKIFADFSEMHWMSSLIEKARIIAGVKVPQPHWSLPAFVHLHLVVGKSSIKAWCRPCCQWVGHLANPKYTAALHGDLFLRTSPHLCLVIIFQCKLNARAVWWAYFLSNL